MSCGQLIPRERLAKIPQARLCAACPAPASPALTGTQGRAWADVAVSAPVNSAPPHGALAATTPSARLARIGGPAWQPSR